MANGAREDARLAAACVASIVASTSPTFTLSPTCTRMEVSVPLVVKLAEADDADEMFPDAETLDRIVPRVTVAVRCAAPALEVGVP